MKTAHNTQQKTRHMHYAALITLSIIISGVEFLSGSHSLKTLSAHMIFHAMFFVALWWSDYKRTDQTKNWSLAVFIVLSAFTTYRLWDMVNHHEPTMMNFQLLVASMLLLIMQSWLLHDIRNQTCSVVCHISQVHIAGDIIAIGLVGLGSIILSEHWLGILDIVIACAVIGYMWALFTKYLYDRQEGITVNTWWLK